MTYYGVVNISNKVLSDEEVSLLQRGLKFCPTPPCPDPGQSRDDLDSLHRRLRLMAFFDEESQDESLTNITQSLPADDRNLLSRLPFKHKKFKRESAWRGPIGPTNLEAFIASNVVDFNNRPSYVPPKKQNLTKKEALALIELKKDKSIIIKPADKGSSIVIMNRTDYLKEGYKQLSDIHFYRHVDENLTKKHMLEINLQIEGMYQDSEIDESVRDHLLNRSCKTANFYLLPKIHKNVHPPPGRPVVAGIGSPTEKISQFVDHFLNPCSVKVKSYVQDTNDFLKRIQAQPQLDQGTLLVTMDVTSLYTNIPNDEGIAASLLALERERLGTVKPTNLSITKLLEMVLKKNNFQFNGNNYLQVGGTAIGTKAAPGFAIIYMGMFEDRYVYTYHLQPLLYLRYIDDIFMLWQHGQAELDTFVRLLNTRVETIKFTHEISLETLSFLDVSVRINKGNLETGLYTKPTDTHDYLLYSSSHPQRCKDSIPYSQFLRIRRLCSSIKEYERNVMKLSLHFLRREYPEELLLEAALKVRGLDRQELLSPKKTDSEEITEPRVFLTTTFHPSDNTLRGIVHKNWDILGQGAQTDNLYKRRLMMGYRRPKNLRDLLVHAGIPRQVGDELVDPHHIPPVPTTTRSQTTVRPEGTETVPIRQRNITEYFQVMASTSLDNLGATVPVNPRSKSVDPSMQRKGTHPSKRGFSFCNRVRNCRYCLRLNKSGKITSKTTGKTHDCMTKISCRSSNLIYCITCTKCNMQYVGQTLLRLKDRFVKHFGSVENADASLTVGRHFSEPGHNGIFDMEISILEFIKKPPRSPASTVIRNRVERRWMHLLRTCAPQGLNIDD